jgi:Spy/CpxP family protein refolding chaperone
MKKLSFKRSVVALASVFLLFLAISFSLEVRAQNPNEPLRDDEPRAQEEEANRDANWRNLLNLTPEQMTRIRAIRQQNVEEAQAIRRRVRQAQRALDQSIYSDTASEAEIEQRTRELVEAQATEIRLRALTELSIRRVLTSEQLNIFRRIRQERMNAQRQRRMENGINRPGPGNRMGGRPRDQRPGNINSGPTLGPPRRIRP